MSLDYWNMKLRNAYVMHDGEYKLITNVCYSEDVDEEGIEEEDNYPEETLQHIRFRLNSEDRFVGYDDFTIKFPDDQWIKPNGNAMLLLRSMDRQVKVAPSESSFRTKLGTNRTSLQDAFNATLKPQYDDPEKMWGWLGKDLVFSDKIALKRMTHTQRTLYYQRTQVGKLVLKDQSVKLTMRHKRVPLAVTKLWGDRIGQVVPLDAADIEESKLEMQRLLYSWIKVSPANFAMAIRESAFIYAIQTGSDEEEIHEYVTFGYNGTVYWFRQLCEIDLQVLQGNLIRELVNDMKTVMLHELDATQLSPEEDDEAR